MPLPLHLKPTKPQLQSSRYYQVFQVRININITITRKPKPSKVCPRHMQCNTTSVSHHDPTYDAMAAEACPHHLIQTPSFSSIPQSLRPHNFRGQCIVVSCLSLLLPHFHYQSKFPPEKSSSLCCVHIAKNFAF